MTDADHGSLTFVQEHARPVRHDAASSRYYLLRLHAPQVAQRARPGQFAMLSCHPAGDALTDPLLPRPLAILDANPDTGEIAFLYFVAGRGTKILHDHATKLTAPSALSAPTGEAFRIVGPLGCGFEALPDVEAHIGVGGGSGVAPLVFFFRRMRAPKTQARHLILASRSADQLARADVVAAPDTTLHEATDDGSRGHKGHAVDCLNALLDGPLKGKRVAIYAAGPEPMMEAAAALARTRGLPCRVSLEARMACGVGVCRSCVVDGLDAHPHTGLHRHTICQDGPVFDPARLAAPWS